MTPGFRAYQKGDPKVAFLVGHHRGRGQGAR